MGWVTGQPRLGPGANSYSAYGQLLGSPPVGWTDDKAFSSRICKGCHYFGVQVRFHTGNPTLLQVGEITVKRMTIIPDQAHLIGALDFRDTVFEREARPETETVVRFLKRHAVIAAVVVLGVFHAGLGD